MVARVQRVRKSYAYVTTEVEAEVSLSDFGVDYLIQELEERVKENDKWEMPQIIVFARKVFGIKDIPNAITVKDQMKLDFFNSHFNDISLEQLEKLLNP